MIFLEEQKQLLRTIFPFEFMTCSFQRKNVMKKIMELHYTSENLPVFKTNKKKTSVLFITKDCYIIIKIWFLHMKKLLKCM